MRILIATVQVPFVRGGAEILAEGLRDACRRAGHEAEIAAMPFKWYPPEKVLDHMLACRLIDVSESVGTRIDRVIGLKFPAYLIPHPSKRLWILHQHRMAYELWDHDYGDLIYQPHGTPIRDAIRHADTTYIPQAEAVYTIAGNVSNRLKAYNGIPSQPLYHPPEHAEQFRSAAPEDYLFFPSRLSPIKRQGLVLEALAQTRQPVRVRFAGAPDLPSHADELKEKAHKLGIAGRVEWLGHITQEQKRDLYSKCLGVVFVPFDEDYGYVTLEAMLSARPVVTCTDSGGPLEFVVPGETGAVAEPDAASLAAALDAVWEDRDRAVAWGEAGRRRYDEMDISWETVVRRLVA